jgi:vacuolar iron transporter family protein
MKNPLSLGLSFGLTSGIITTLGVIVGLNASTHSKAAVIGGILTVALADSFSDALGMHVAEESVKNVSQRSTWEATFSTFFSKLLFAISFLIPLLLLPFNIAVVACAVWGIAVIAVFSYTLAKKRGENPVHTVAEHVTVSLLVVALTQALGMVISKFFS